MKITAKQYARALYESVDGKSAGQVKSVIERFVELLAGQNQIDKAEKISAEFIKIWNEKNGIVESEITSALELDKGIIKILKDYVARLSGAKKVVVEEKVERALLGGMIIKYGDKVLDGSLKNSLLELKEKLVK